MRGVTYIIILNYNTWRDTIECMESVRRTKNAAYKIVVCDNASSDDSVEKLQAWAKRQTENVPTILTAEKNLGYSGGNNMGVKFALRQDDCAYLWILNNDTTVDENALCAMIEKQKAVGCGGVGSAVLHYRERNKIQLVGGRLDLQNFVIRGVLADEPLENLRADLPIDTLSGPSFLLTADFVRAVGLFDETYFLYCEELELAARAKAKGFSLAYAETAYVYHKGSASAGKKSTAYRDYHVARSWLIFIKRHHAEHFSRLLEMYRKLMYRRLKHLHLKRFLAIRAAIKSAAQTD